MQSKTYVSDPKLWATFYGKLMHNNNTFHVKKRNKKRNQIGGGFTGNRYKKSYVIPVTPQNEERKQDSIQLVSPMTAIEERAKSEHQTDKLDNAPRVKLIKQRSRGKNHIRHKSSVKYTTLKKKGSTRQNTKRKTNSRKRKLSIDNKPSVWDFNKRRRK